MQDVEDVVDPDGPPPWLHLLTDTQKAWREREITSRRNPDQFIKERLVEAGKWPPKPERE